MPYIFKLSLVTMSVAILLSSCASAPERVQLPKSSLIAPTESVDGSAIAFQASDGSCNKSSFLISPRLADGKYGPAEKIEISSSTFKMKSTSLKQDKYASSNKQLYVRPMAPGTYAVTRIWCYSSNGTRESTYFTNPERVDIFAEFDVDAGKTNYIGKITVGRTFGGSSARPTFSVSDASDIAAPFFEEKYADKVAPMQVKLASAKESQEMIIRNMLKRLRTDRG